MKPLHRSAIARRMAVVIALFATSGCDSPNGSPVEQSIAKALQALEAEPQAQRTEAANLVFARCADKFGARR